MVVVLHGLAPSMFFFEDVCRRLAKIGYFALCPLFFARLGKEASFEAMYERARQFRDADLLGELDAVVAWGAASGRADPRRFATMGFSWGGRLAWLHAATATAPAAAIVWYGQLVTAKSELRPKTPLEAGASLRCPVLGIYGGADDIASADEIAAMRAELARGNTGGEIVVYPDAGHSFVAEHMPTYREDDARAAWAKSHAWLRDHGV